MSDSTILYLSFPWQDPASRVPVYVQATAASGIPQRVTIACPALNFSQTAMSDTSTPFGAQYLNVLTHVATSQTYQFNVTVEYYGVNGWTPSAVVAQNSIQLDEYGYVAMALSNDAGSDQDYNDTVVMISAYNNSTD